MWVTFFSLAMAASVWFSAANLAVQLGKERAAFNTAIESRDLPRLQDERLSGAPNSRFN